MNNQQLLSRVQELHKQLVAMRRAFAIIENLSDDAFSGYDDQWPDTLECKLNELQRMFRRFHEAGLKDDFLDFLVAGRPQVAELAVEVAAAARKAANGLLGSFDTLHHEDSPASGFSSWHWFEHAFRDFLAKESRLLSVAGAAIDRGPESNQYPSVENHLES